MILLLDTNVVLDVLLTREPFAAGATRIMELAEQRKLNCFITANNITDIFYILRKYIQSPREREEIIRGILAIIDIVNITRKDIYRSFEHNAADFEDALLAQCAVKIKADYIVTRNQKDFKGSVVAVISPVDLLKQLSISGS
jgi:predicted nucleic acid-binding protein